MDFNIFKNLRPGKKTGGFALVIASAAAIGAPITLVNEGMNLKPYYDSVGVRTVCGGETEHVEERNHSENECVDRFEIQYGYYSYATARFYNAKATAVVTPEIHAAFTDTAYNVGLATMEKSTMIREINNGKAVSACNGILKYYMAGGRDCRVRSNNCLGVWSRRLKIHSLCMKGIK